MILVTGASGSTGGAVLAEVLKTNKPVKAMYRSQEDAVKTLMYLPAVIADFADRPSLRRALKDVDTVYLVCSPVHDLVELESNMVDACREAGVRHVVLNSALGAGDYPKSFPSWHRKVEEKLKASGLGHTILRPNSYMQNILTYLAPSIRSQGAFYAAMGDARTSFIDVRDVARVAAKMLTSPEHIGKTYELNGPEALTYAEVAEKISRASGRKVQYVDISVEKQRKSMLDQGMPEWQVTALLDLQAYYTGGKGGAVDDVLAGLLGCAPTTMDQFLAEFADRFGDKLDKPSEARTDALNAKSGMTQEDMKKFIRAHFEEFVNRKNLDIADVNFAQGFVDHGADVPRGTPAGPAGAKQYVGGAYKRFPDLHVNIEDLIAEDDRVVVRNHWTGTDATTQQRVEFFGIVIWRIANRKIVERWAYLEPPHPLAT